MVGVWWCGGDDDNDYDNDDGNDVMINMMITKTTNMTMTTGIKSQYDIFTNISLLLAVVHNYRH